MRDSESITYLEVEAERALFEGKLDGLVSTFYINERPLQGLAGMLDWRFRGVLSSFIRAGSVSGHVGECVYLPIQREDRTYHLIFLGGGFRSPYGRRGLIPDDAFKALQKNLTSLKLPSLGLSRGDFGGLDPEYISKQLKGVPLCLVP